MKAEYDFSQARRGAVIAQPGKTRITIYLDNDILDAFRARADEAGRGYQSLINDALRVALSRAPAPVDEATLRKVLREELHATP
ncbi:MAG: BrnA antitoxin family protein [Pseudomonadota bacterium]|uniref:BrnA antitoxin family protein n=1 Tax=Thermithiobacillus tepidarius TaxID=929 RepID=UPI0003FE839A|nr:BrnA antitoxin family protein [Thermithiobacillus tepidarius]